MAKPTKEQIKFFIQEKKIAKERGLTVAQLREDIKNRKLQAKALSRLPRRCCLKCGEKLAEPLTSETNHGPASWCVVCRRLLGLSGAGSQPLTVSQREAAGLEPSFNVRQSKERIPYIRRVETWYEVSVDPRKKLNQTFNRIAAKLGI